MALSQVQIVNKALTTLGQDRVISINDDTEAARVMRSLWEITRDTLLAGFPWKFAIKRAELPALADAPLGTQWALQFALPEECLRLVQVGEDAWNYRATFESFALEGGNVLTNEAAPLFVRYVQRVENTGLWPVLFGQTMAARLAVDASEKLTTSSTKSQAAAVAYEVALREARRQNAIERPPQQMAESDWLASRDD
jgi:hypothetical protein